jgi:hypothetical protein
MIPRSDLAFGGKLMGHQSRRTLGAVAAAFALVALSSLDAQTGDDVLVSGFRNPPDSARPRTWWHWTGGNITREGITKDLEWMKRVGIAGFQLADVGTGGGQTVAHTIDFGTPEWFDAVRHAASEADRLGLEMTLFSSPGWSETGGPWVTPAQGMKRLVWTEKRVAGPSRFDEVLPQAPANLGFYADSVVLAFPLPQDEGDGSALTPAVTSSGAKGETAALFDADVRTVMTVSPAGPNQPAWMELRFDRPFGARALTIGGRAGGRAGVPVGRVMVGDAPDALHTLLTLPGTQLYRQGSERTYAFPQTTARIWRIEMTAAPLDPAMTMSQDPPRAVASYELGTFLPHSGARVNRGEEKAGANQFLFEYDSVPTPDVPASAAVDSARVVDLTAKMGAGGRLQWDVPPGRWLIQRFGYVPTGSRNRPATGPGSGLEADKLSGKHMEAYVHGYLDPVAANLGPLFGKSLRYVVMDSWEAGMQNWTDEMIGEFRRRRGYDPTPYLPAMTGYVVGSAEISDRFLWDFRRTLADMWADYHYGTMTRMLAERGLGTYAEAAGVSLEIPEDTLLNKKQVTIPMAEFWVRDLHPRLMYLQDVRGAASASHVYGKPLTAAESFTGGGYEAPFTLKKVADYWLSQGINRMVFHTSAHQPLDTKPGNTMVGTHINRNITWAEQAGPLVTYFSRQLFMLQQGQFVADLAYLLNEGAPSTPPIWGAGTTPQPPNGHDFDFINADVLLNLATVDDAGRIALPSGMRYRVLVLPETRQMRPELIRKLRTLVEGGATIVGPRPDTSPSLAGYPQSDADVHELAAAVWGDLDGESRTIRYVGKGRVVWGRSLAEILRLMNVPEDFEYGGGRPGVDLAWLHRRAGDTDIYYVANLTDEPQDLDLRLRVAKREAELWRPDTGSIAPASFVSDGDRTRVRVTFEPREMMFVVFPRAASATSRTVATPARSSVATLDGAWRVSFPPNLGAPPAITLATLQSWTKNQDQGVRYFSGTATYTKSVTALPQWFRTGARMLLDLGRVADIAEITVNGKTFDPLWKPPYRVDVTGALRPGANAIAIKVTNEWTNRIMGDQAAPAGQRVLSPVTGGRGGGAAEPPESGLLGPVTVLRQM